MITKFNEINEFTFNSENFKNKYNSISQENLCKNLKIYGKTTDCQNIDVVEKSLYTVSIFTLETLRKYSFENRKDKVENFKLLKSEDFQNLGKN